MNENAHKYIKEPVTDRALYQAVFDASLAGFFVVDAEGHHILKSNSTGEQMFGYGTGELNDKKIDIIFSEDYKKEFEIQIKKPVSESVQILGLRKDGSQFPMDIRIATTMVGGQIIATVYCKPADIGVFESDRKLRTLVGNVPGIVYRCRIDRKWTMEFISDACTTISGYAPEDFYGKGLMDWGTLIHPEDKNRVWEEVQKAIGQKRPYQIIYRIIAADNKLKWICEQGSGVTDETGKIYRLEGFMQDITEQKKNENGLTAEKEKLAEYLDTAASIFLVINRDHTIVLVNKKGCEILGYSKEEIIGKNWFNRFIPRKGRKNLIALFDSIMEGDMEPPDAYENIVVTNKGSRRLIRWRNALLNNADGSVKGLISSGVDITEERTARDTLFLRNKALEAAGNGIIIADAKNPELPIIYCNPAFTRLTGYSYDEAIGKNCRFLQNFDRDQEAITTMAKAIQKGEACRVVVRNYRKDGSLFWNELSITPLYDENHKLTHFIGVQNDVSDIQRTKKQLEEYTNTLEEKVKERTQEIEATVRKLVAANVDLEDQIQETKRAENKAQRSQAQFTAIAKNFPKGLIVVFNTDFELVYVEGEELKRVNLKKTDFEGKRIDDIPLFSAGQIEKIKADIIKTIKGNSLSFELEFQDNSYSVNSTPLYSDEKKVVWALFVYHNITEQKQVQQELAKALKVEQELNELKSRFISMASHEFRTPLSAILSSAILIGKQNEPGKEERRMKHVERIRINVKNLVVILNDFLSLGKLEEGKVKAIPKSFELVQFSKLLVEEMESSKKERQTIILKHPETEISVHLDPKLLNHILVNLLSNACKYSDEGQKIKMTIHQEENMVIFTIRDKGIGISKKEQKNLFERFFRAENATNIQGTGLGLHIVKQYTELMNGTVSFKSQLGKGSTFMVQLPLNLEHNEKNIIDRGQ